MKELKFNRPNDDENDIGPLISSSQKGRVEKFVERAAKQNHISITAGGKSPGGKGFFFEPTVDRRRDSRTTRSCGKKYSARSSR